jgi:DNA replication licensing factor MCM3
LSPTVSVADAHGAEAILRFALFKEVMKSRKSQSGHKRRKVDKAKKGVDSDEEEMEDEEESDEGANIEETQPVGKSKYPTRSRGAPEATTSGSQPANQNPSDQMEMDPPSIARPITEESQITGSNSTSSAALTPERYVLRTTIKSRLTLGCY